MHIVAQFAVRAAGIGFADISVVAVHIVVAICSRRQTVRVAHLALVRIRSSVAVQDQGFEVVYIRQFP